MRPIAARRDELRYPLDVLLGTKAQIRVLRVLVQSDRAMSASEIHQQTGVSHPGTLKVLVRLEKTGLVRSQGSGRSKLYALTPGSQLTESLQDLFLAEEHRHRRLLDELRAIFSSLTNPVESAWLSLDGYQLGDTLELGFLTNPSLLARTKVEVRDRLVTFEKDYKARTESTGLTRADLQDYKPGDIALLAGYSPFERRASSSSIHSHSDLDERSLERARRLAEMIRRDPTIVARARVEIDRILRSKPELARTDLLEWQRILSSYSERRLLDFLLDTGERATRLRQSSPFFAMLTPSEKARVEGGLESGDA